MSKLTFDDSKPFSKVLGDSPAKFAQDNHYFDLSGDELSQEHASMTVADYHAIVKKVEPPQNPVSGTVREVPLEVSVEQPAAAPKAKAAKPKPKAGKPKVNTAQLKELQGMHHGLITGMVEEAGLKPATGRGSKKANIDTLMSLDG